MRAFQDQLISQVFKLTDYQRVLYYLFHPDGHGQVAAERRFGYSRPWTPETELLLRQLRTSMSRLPALPF